MSELVKYPAEGLPTLTRNGITLPLFKGQFGKLSKENAGLEFPYPVLSEDKNKQLEHDHEFLNGLKFIGKDFVAARMTKVMRTIFGSIMVEAWDKDTGAPDWSDWLEAAQEFTEGEEKRDLLQAEKDDYSDKMSKITDSEAFMANPEKFTDELNKLGKACIAINEQLKEIQVKIDAKTAKRNATKKANAEALAARQKVLIEQKQKISELAVRLAEGKITQAEYNNAVSIITGAKAEAVAATT